MTYTATPSVSVSGGSEGSAPTLETTWPAGLAPGSASGTSWSCSTSGANVKCGYTGPLPLAAGTALPPVTIPGTVAGSASGAQAVAASLWENGAVVAQTTDTGAPVPAAQSAPALGLTWSDNAGGQLAQGETVTYSAVGQISAAGAADAGAIGFSARFPNTESLENAAGTNWSCTISAPTVSCNWTGGTVAAGARLNAITVQVGVGVDATGSAQVTGTLSSSSALPTSVSANDDAVVASTPTLDVALADNSSGDLSLSGSVHYTVNTSVSSSGWNEADAPIVTDNFPAVFSSVTKDSSSSAWSCSQANSATVITETCAYTGTLPIAAGSSLQALQFDNTVETTSTTGHSADNSVAVTSADAPVAVANDYARIAEGPAPNFSITASAPSSAASTYGLVLDAAVLPNGGATSYSPTIEAALPSGQFFASAPSPSGWNCAVSGAGQTLLTCTTASSSIAAGTVLTAIDATVVPAAVGLHTAQVTMSDSLDGAFEVSTSSTTDSPAADLILGASPMTAQVSAGSSYTLSLSASTGSSGGEVFGNLVLDVNLPAGENFTVAPTAAGWSCTVPGTNTASLSCTYSVSTASPVAPGTSLAPGGRRGPAGAGAAGGG